MSAPGTLIPTDVPSVKDSNFKPYNPITNKIPTHYPLNDSEVAYSGAKPFQGEGSSQNPPVESVLVLDRRSRSENAEFVPMFSGPTVDSVGTSKFLNRPPSNQLDHLASSGIGAALYKGNRGAHAVDGGVRMNMNVVPYNQNPEDPKNLFADLNPFQIKGTGKTSAYNKAAENKVDELQRQRNNVNPGRPPAPLMWKSRYACNEVPRKKEYDYMEGLFPRINHEPNDYTTASSASTSNTASERINNESSENISSWDSKAKNYMFDSTLPLASSTSHFNRLTLAEDGNSNFKGEHLKEAEDLQSETVDVVKENNETDFLNHRKFRHDRFLDTNLKLKDPESPSSSVEASRNRVDQVFDDVDVGECEIPWEDLVIGERIGLGNLPSWSDHLYFVWQSQNTNFDSFTQFICI